MKNYLLWMVAALSLPFSSTLWAQPENPSVSEQTNRIIHGSDTNKSDWPFMAAVVWVGTNSPYVICGASFLGGRYLLTAYSCGMDIINHSSVYDDYPDKVLIGTNDLNDPAGNWVDILNVYRNDSLAIIELTKTVNAEIVQFADETLVDELSAGDSLKFIGWGSKKEGSSYISPSILQQIDLSYVDLPTCLNVMEGYNLTEDYFCTGHSSLVQEGCSGDVGGPILYNDQGTYKQVGVAVSGSLCDSSELYYNYYKKIAKYTDWIAQIKSGVSYKQLIYTSSQNQYVQFTIPFGNNGADSFSITDIELPEGITVTNSTCASSLEPGDSCVVSIDVDRVAAGHYQVGMGQESELKIMTDHPLVPEFKIALHFTNEFYPGTSDDPSSSDSSSTSTSTSGSSSSGSGGASLGLMMMALFGLMFRRRQTKQDDSKAARWL